MDGQDVENGEGLVGICKSIFTVVHEGHPQGTPRASQPHGTLLYKEEHPLYESFPFVSSAYIQKHPLNLRALPVYKKIHSIQECAVGFNCPHPHRLGSTPGYGAPLVGWMLFRKLPDRTQVLVTGIRAQHKTVRGCPRFSPNLWSEI